MYAWLWLKIFAIKKCQELKSQLPFSEGYKEGQG
jgi:hypothetical protein